MARSRPIRDGEPTVPQLKNGTTDELGMVWIVVRKMNGEQTTTNNGASSSFGIATL
jgi:hypothetical protein